jgi:hypothetical protein
MHETLASESTRTSLRKLWGDIQPGGRYCALLREWYRGKEWIAGFGPAGSTLGTPRMQRAGAPRDIFHHAVQNRLARVVAAEHPPRPLA